MHHHPLEALTQQTLALVEAETGRTLNLPSTSSPNAQSLLMVEAIASVDGWSRVKSLSVGQNEVVFAFPIDEEGEAIATITVKRNEDNSSSPTFTVSCAQFPSLSKEWGEDWRTVTHTVFGLFSAFLTTYSRELAPILRQPSLVSMKSPSDPASLVVFIDRTSLLVLSLQLTAEDKWITSAVVKDHPQYSSVLSHWDRSISILDNIRALFPGAYQLPRSSLECSICGEVFLDQMLPSIICPACSTGLHPSCCLQWMQMDPGCRTVFDRLLGHCPACSAPLQL